MSTLVIEENAETEKQINTLNNKPQTPEWIVKGHLPHGNLFPEICWPIVSVKITIIIPITTPEIAAPLVIQGNQTRPSKTIKNWNAIEIEIQLKIIIAGLANVDK